MCSQHQHQCHLLVFCQMNILATTSPLPLIVQQFHLFVLTRLVVVEVKNGDKKHACKFCTKRVIKMSDHLARCHREEVEVAHVLAVEIGSKYRKQAWSTRLMEGDNLHNCMVLEYSKGVPTVYRTQKDNIAVDLCHALSAMACIRNLFSIYMFSDVGKNMVYLFTGKARQRYWRGS